jgi:O-antigen/teichoic acid export membrane protein
MARHGARLWQWPGPVKAGRQLRGFLARAATLAGGRLVASLLSAIWLFVAARNLSLRDFGDLGVILATTTVMISVTERGVQTALAIHVAEHGAIDSRSVCYALRRRLPVAAIGAAINAALYVFATHDSRWLIPAVAAVSLIGTTVYGTLLAAYRSVGLVRADALNEVMSRLGVLAIGSVVLIRGGGLLAAVATYAAADAISAIVVGLAVTRRHVSRQAPERTLDLSLRSTMPFALMMVVLMVYYRLDTYLVATMRGDEAAGLYSAAYRLLDVATVPAIAVGSLVLSVTVRQTAAGRLKTLRELALVSLAVGVSVALIGIFAGQQIMVLLYGPRFAVAGTCASLLLLSAVPSVAVGTALPIVFPKDRHGTLRLAAGVLVLNLVTNAVFITLAGTSGAALANLLSQTVLAAGVYRMAVLQRRSEEPPAQGAGRSVKPDGRVVTTAAPAS